MTTFTKPAGKERSLIRDRDFRLFRGGDLVSRFGAEMTLFALSLVMVNTLERLRRPDRVAGGVPHDPVLALRIFAGVWQERRARRPVMIVGDILRGRWSSPSRWARPWAGCRWCRSTWSRCRPVL